VKSIAAFLFMILLSFSSAFCSDQDSTFTIDSDSLLQIDRGEPSDSFSADVTQRKSILGYFGRQMVYWFSLDEVISAEDIDNSLAESLGELLDMWSLMDVGHLGSLGQPEIATVAGYPRGLEIFIEGGFFQQQNLYFPQRGNLDLNQVLFPNISSIRLLPVGLANIWGTGRGMLGLDIDTKRLRRKEPYSRATANRGPFGTYRTQVELGRKLTKKGEFYFTAEFKETDGYQINSDYDGMSFWGATAFDLSKNLDWKISGYRNRSKLGVPFFTDANYRDARKNSESWGINSALLIREHHRAFLNLRLQYDNQKQEIKSEGYGFESKEGNETIALKAEQLFLMPRNQIQIEAYTEREVFKSLTNEKELYGGFLSASDLYQLGPNTSLFVSAKMNKEEGLDMGISALAGLSHGFSKRVSLFGTVGTIAGFPNTMERYWPASSFSFKDTTADYFEEGNEFLKSQRSTIVDFGMNVESKNLNLSGYVFGAKIDDMLFWSNVDTTVFFGHFKPTNTSAEIRGASVNSRYEPFSHLGLYFSYTYKWSRNSDTDLLLPFSPEHSLFSYIQYESEFLKKEIGLKLRLEGKMLSERFMDQYQKDREPEMAIVNAKITIRYLDFNFHYTIRNITDEEYRLFDDYTMPGRTHWWGFYWEFYD
jgi:outer membrane cobalamin receptor